jgi:hypothetical protein
MQDMPSARAPGAPVRTSVPAAAQPSELANVSEDAEDGGE